jgi:hypothetical protein
MLTLSLLLLAAATDPLAPARAGQVQCYDPVPAQKLCRAMGSYDFAADGTISNLAVTRIQDAPAIVMFARSPVVLKDDKECSAGALKETDIEKIEVNGQPLDAATLAVARGQIVAALPDFMKTGEPLCSAYSPNPDGTMSATVDVGGVAHPELTATVRWVDPAEGWKVTP